MPRTKSTAKDGPQSSQFNKRKAKKKEVPIAYDEQGRIRGLDLCDCFNQECPGCWSNCEECGSNKCGLECRINRQFSDDTLTFDGKELTIVHPVMLLTDPK